MIDGPFKSNLVAADLVYRIPDGGCLGVHGNEELVSILFFCLSDTGVILGCFKDKFLIGLVYGKILGHGVWSLVCMVFFLSLTVYRSIYSAI